MAYCDYCYEDTHNTWHCPDLATKRSPSIDAGAKLFEDGCFIQSSERFRDGLAAHVVVPDSQRDYFQWEIDSLRLYADSVRNLSRTCPYCGGVSRAVPGGSQYSGPWKCVSCGARDEPTIHF